MINDHHHFHFFHNKEVDALYLTLALVAFANSLISIFVPIYLWELGFPMWQILGFFVLLSAYFMIFTVIFLPLFRNVSDKMMMFLSIPSLIIYYLFLSQIANYPIIYFIVPAFVALSMLLFNTGYHLGFTVAVDDGRVGREVGMRFVIEQVSQFSGPFVGGFLITVFGFGTTFLIGSLILLLSVVPMFFFPKRMFSRKLSFKRLSKYLTDKELLPFTISGIGYSVERIIDGTVWAIFLFLALGNVEALGSVVSVGLLLGAVITLLVGYLADSGKRRKALSWSAVLLAAIWFIRPFLFLPVGIIGSHVLGKTANSALLVSWSIQYYKMARAVKHTSLFILSREFLYHVSRFVVLSVLALLAFVLPLKTFFVVAFLMAGVLSLMFLFANKEKRVKDLKI